MFETIKLAAITAGIAFVLGMIVGIQIRLPHDMVMPFASVAVVAVFTALGPALRRRD